MKSQMKEPQKDSLETTVQKHSLNGVRLKIVLSPAAQYWKSGNKGIAENRNAERKVGLQEDYDATLAPGTHRALKTHTLYGLARTHREWDNSFILEDAKGNPTAIHYSCVVGFETMNGKKH
jgi:hypothetical protein